MKKIFFSVTFLILCATGCKESFIDLLPSDTVTVDLLYKTDKDFQDAVVGIYAVYQTQYQNMYLFGDVRADDSWDELVKGTAGAVDNYSLNVDDNLLITTWRNYYSIIYRANTVLTKIESVDAASLKNKDRHVGEARFLRALAYFDLVRIFGDVPLVATPLSAEESYQTAREKVDKIYDEVIVKDLADAEAKLPLRYTGADVGRATKGAAKALLGKVHLTRKDFQKAEAKLQEVTTMGYALLPNYADLFDYTKNEHHAEYIFDIEYDPGLGGEGSLFTNRFAPKVPAVIDYFGILGGQDDQNAPPRSLFDLFEVKDKRKDITAANGFTNASGVFVPIVPTSNNMSTFTRKYMIRLATGNDSPANWKVIRYADVLLMLAEALTENGKPTNALTHLNQVRTRAGVAPYADGSQADTRARIALERRLELSFEGHRWFDLVRTGQALTVLQKLGMKPHMTLWPIPLAQVRLMNNPTLFPQNPGYF